MDIDYAAQTDEMDIDYAAQTTQTQITLMHSGPIGNGTFEIEQKEGEETITLQPAYENDGVLVFICNKNTELPLCYMVYGEDTTCKYIYTQSLGDTTYRYQNIKLVENIN